MLSNTVIKRYAKALFDLAVEQKSVEPIYKDMLLVNSVTSEKDLYLMLNSPIINPDKKISVINAIFNNQIDKITLAYLVLITKKRREMYIPAIANQFIALYKQEKGIKLAHLKTPIAIDQATQDKIIDQLKKFTNKSIELITEIDNTLIGGFVLTFDNKQYDASLLKSFNQLEKEFN